MSFKTTRWMLRIGFTLFLVHIMRQLYAAGLDEGIRAEQSRRQHRQQTVAQMQAEKQELDQAAQMQAYEATITGLRARLDKQERNQHALRAHVEAALAPPPAQPTGLSCATAEQLSPRQRAHAYKSVYRAARCLFQYESPLPVLDAEIPALARARFARATRPALVDFRVEAMQALWREWVSAGHVTPAHRHAKLLQGWGGMYPDLDRTVLFCLLRHAKPRRVVEIGSGESTAVAQAALALNAKEPGAAVAQHTVIEPYRADEVPRVPGLTVLVKEVQTVENFAVFDDLGRNDVLFIDSSHVTMPYGDTLLELVTILPRLAPGVLVHIHDIFLPFDYSPGWMLKNSVYTEQWLVALMLYGATTGPDREWEVVFASRLMAKDHPGVLLEMDTYPLPQGQSDPNGGSLWIRKCGPARRGPGAVVS